MRVLSGAGPSSAGFEVVVGYMNCCLYTCTRGNWTNVRTIGLEVCLASKVPLGRVAPSH